MKWIELLESSWQDDIGFMQGMTEVGKHLSSDEIVQILRDIETKEVLSMEFAKKIGEEKQCRREWQKIKMAFHEKADLLL